MPAAPTSPHSVLMNHLPGDDGGAPSRRAAFASIARRIDAAHMDARRGRDLDREGFDTVADARDAVLRLAAIVGGMCGLFLSAPHDPPRGVGGDEERPPTAAAPEDDPFWAEGSAEKGRVARTLGEVLLQLFRTARVCDINLRTSVLKKIELNGRKYPVELCKGKSGKYTEYSDRTGITPTKGQSTVHSPAGSGGGGGGEDAPGDDATVEGVTALVRDFADERSWDRYHTPRNIALALLGEVGELAELFQWKGDDARRDLELGEEEKDKVGQEVADVAIYLLRLADVCRVRLGDAATGLLEGQC